MPPFLTDLRFCQFFICCDVQLTEIPHSHSFTCHPMIVNSTNESIKQTNQTINSNLIDCHLSHNQHLRPRDSAQQNQDYHKQPPLQSPQPPSEIKPKPRVRSRQAPLETINLSAKVANQQVANQQEQQKPLVALTIANNSPVTRVMPSDRRVDVRFSETEAAPRSSDAAASTSGARPQAPRASVKSLISRFSSSAA